MKTLFLLIVCALLIAPTTQAESTLTCDSIRIDSQLTRAISLSRKIKRNINSKLKPYILTSNELQAFATKKIRNTIHHNRRAVKGIKKIIEDIPSCLAAKECHLKSTSSDLENYLNATNRLFLIYIKTIRKIPLTTNTQQQLQVLATRLNRKTNRLTNKLSNCLLNSTTKNLKIAFVGDQSLSSNAVAVLQLIKNQGAEAAVILGDFAYNETNPNSPLLWEQNINNILGASFPVIATIGNHDRTYWNSTEGYRELLEARKSRMTNLFCSGETGVKENCKFKGLSVLVSGVGTAGSNQEDYLNDQLKSNNALWKICAWHKNQAAMQVGGKGNEVGWTPYNICQKYGAIIATGHEHSYSRTKSLIDIENQLVNPAYPSPEQIFVAPGSTFAFVSGLGGHSVRPQQRCLPTSYPYGCKQEWAKIYSSSQSATYGALFITFHVGNNPKKARGEFVDINGIVQDSFDITSDN